MFSRVRRWRPRVWLAYRLGRLLWPLLEPALKEHRLWREDGPHGAARAAARRAERRAEQRPAEHLFGHITIGEHVSLGYGTTVIAGTHDYREFGEARLHAIPPAGCDIAIGDGVWVCENVVIVGPCWIGEHAVVAAGAVVTSDVPAYAVVAGVPARQIATIAADVAPSSARSEDHGDTGAEPPGA